MQSGKTFLRLYLQPDYTRMPIFSFDVNITNKMEDHVNPAIALHGNQFKEATWARITKSVKIYGATKAFARNVCAAIIMSSPQITR